MKGQEEQQSERENDKGQNGPQDQLSSTQFVHVL